MNNNDIILSTEAKEIFRLMKKYEKNIKDIFDSNNINLTHITSVSPKELEGRILRKSINRANNYETEIVNGVFASSMPVNGKNPYIARNNSGMIFLGDSTYIYGDDNIIVNQDSEGKKHAILKQPNYIYHINSAKFNPVCHLTKDSINHKPIFIFSEEWISDYDVNILDNNQVKLIEQVKDVTNLLSHYTILCDIHSQGIGIQARKFKTKTEAIEFIETKIKEGSVRNINHEIGIRDREVSDFER